MTPMERTGQDRHQRPRDEYFGGADAKDIIPLPPWGCRRSFVMRKVGIPVDDPDAYAAKFESNEGPIARGRKLEEPMRDELRERLGSRDAVRVHEESMPAVGEVFAPDWLDAHPDAVVDLTDEAVLRRLLALCGITDPEVAERLRGKTIDYEAKTCAASDFFRIAKDGPRDYDVIQCMHEMASNGADACVLHYLNAEYWRQRFFVIFRDPAWEREQYIPAAGDLWALVERAKAAIDLGDSPDVWDAFLPERLPEGSQACDSCPRAGTCWDTEWLRISQLNTGAVERVSGDPEWDAAARRLLEAKAIADDADMFLQEAQVEVKRLMGDRVAVEGGGVKIYWKPQKSKRVDTTALRRDLPEVAEKYSKESESRPFRVYPSKI